MMTGNRPRRNIAANADAFRLDRQSGDPQSFATMDDRPARPEQMPEVLAGPVYPTAWSRFAAYAALMLADHGIFRLLYRNWHEVAPGVYRSNQPAPHQLARAAAAGIRTVVNLRGVSTDAYHLLEREACERLGLDLINCKVMSREAPRTPQLKALFSAFEIMKKPVLLHCKSGADRAGLASALYLLTEEGKSVEDAMGQLNWRFGHWRKARTGVLDFFLETYRDHRARTGESFKDWLRGDYNPYRMDRQFRENRWASMIVDRVLRRE